MSEDTALVEALVSQPPELHVRGGQPRIGGLGPDVRRRSVRNVRGARPEGDRFEVLETGAGLSTLLLLALGASHVTSVDPTPGLRERIAAEAERRRLDLSTVETRERFVANDQPYVRIVSGGFQ